MNITEQILEATCLAVGDYLDISGIRREDEIPERSLSVHMAIHLNRLLRLPAPNEEPYTRIARRLGIADSDPALLLIDQMKADVAVYDGEKPIAVIENKIFSDARRSLVEFAQDLHKGDPIRLSERVPIYAVGLICETKNGDVKWVERSLRRQLAYSKETCTRAINEKWHWCIGCIREWRGTHQTNA